ncbi:hypothetical protein RHOFW104R3_21650 [Rhodanobacter denitrificans]|nr:hypothetical protein RHOFW104R3_21650 [Rhodanobacter denitrificans]
MVEQPHIQRSSLVMDKLTTQNFQNKAKIYQAAALIMAIMSAAEKNNDFNKVREALEKLMFPPDATSSALDLMSHLRAAMADLSKLLFPANPRNQMSWAHTWLHEIGVEESNPSNLSLFAMQCMDYFINAREILGKFQLQV